MSARDQAVKILLLSKWVPGTSVPHIQAVRDYTRLTHIEHEQALHNPCCADCAISKARHP